MRPGLLSILIPLYNEEEFIALLEALSHELGERRAQGRADEREHYTGIRLDPGYRERQQARRLEWKRGQARWRAGRRTYKGE